MKIDNGAFLIGSGKMGFDLTDAFDCNIYLFDAGDSYVMFDTGAGMGAEQILDVCRADGIDPGQIDHIFLTHAHADHAGGLAHLRRQLTCSAYAGARTAEIVSAGDADAVSLTGAREAGIYPADYVYDASPVEHALDDGEVWEIGPLSIEVIATPGHSHDHVSYLVTTPRKRYLVSGDAIFHSGKVVLQYTYDCDVAATCASIQRLAEFDFDALLPGHLAFSLQRGKHHVETACTFIERFECPPSLP